jgi:peptide/nickel transport system substrate-binding protein
MATATPLISTVLGMTLLITACTSPSAAPASEQTGSAPASAPKRISVAIRGDPLQLSGRIGGAGAGSVPGAGEVEDLINSNLVVTDHLGKYHPMLAQDVPTTENGLWKVLPDGTMEMTWKLKPGVTWHDGAPFTSRDVLFTTQVERDEELEVIRNTAYRYVDRVTAPDASTVTVYWKRAFINADTMFNSFALPMPEHLLADSYQNQKATFIEQPFWSSGYIGTGPFRLTEFVPGVHAVLAKNPSFIFGAPRIDEIEVKFIPDPSTLGANILAGEVDLTLGGRLSLDWGTQIRDRWNAGRMVSQPPTSQISAWPQLLNPSPPLERVEARRALQHAVDRQAIIDSLVAGLSPVAYSVVSPMDAEYPFVESSIVKYEFDRNRATQLLAGLGYTRGPDGRMSGPGGPMVVEIRARANDEAQVKTLLAVADYWEQLGITVEQVHFPAQQASDREFRATRKGYEVVRQPAGVNAFSRYHGSQTPLPENEFSGQNRTRYMNPEFDSWIDGMFTTIPMKERMDYAAKIVHRMTDQALLQNLFYDVVPVMISNRLTNVAGPGDVWDVHQWDVKQG